MNYLTKAIYALLFALMSSCVIADPPAQTANSPSQVEIIVESQGAIDASIIVNDIKYAQIKLDDAVSQYRSNLPFQLRTNKVVVEGLVDGESEIFVTVNNEALPAERVTGAFDTNFSYTAIPGYELVNAPSGILRNSNTLAHQEVVEMLMKVLNDEPCTLNFLSNTKGLRAPNQPVGNHTEQRFQKIAWFSPHTVTQCQALTTTDNVRIGILFNLSNESPQSLIPIDQSDDIYGLGVLKIGDDEPIVFYQLSLRQLWSAL